MANKVLSIYVGNEAIRIAELQPNKNKSVILCNAAEVKTPDNCVNDGYLVDVAAVAEAIRSSIFGRGFTAKDVIFTIQSKKIASKDFEVDFVKNDATLQSMLYANSNEYFPMSNQTDYTFAFSRLENFTDEEGKKSRISAVAAPNDIAKSYQELAKELKLNVKAIDYFGNSIIQLLSMQMVENEVDMVLQIEKDATYVNVMRGKTLILQRSVPYGKNAVVNSLMDVKKISEKDANTLLSNETLLDQHVTADEYASTVQYLVNGVGRVVEYHRGKNKNDVLQGIKIFGEGSAIAGIDKILQREMGAPVERFESLSGVQVRGQASLTAEQVLRYLPNIGAVINPMDLAVYEGKKRASVNTDATFKALVVILILAVLGMGGWSAYEYYVYTQKEEEKAAIDAKIKAIQDIEEIAQKYELALATYDIFDDFQQLSNNDNEYILQFFRDIIEVLPRDVYIDKLEAKNGYLEITFITGAPYLHMTAKNEISDAIIQLQNLEYVYNFSIGELEEKYVTYFITGVDEHGEYVLLRDEPKNGEVEGELIKFEEGKEYPEEYANYVTQTFVTSEFKVVLNLGYPVVEVEEEVAVPEAVDVEESGEEAAE